MIVTDYPPHPAHALHEITETRLRLRYAAAPRFHLLGGEDRDGTAHHVGRDRDRSPAHEIGESLGESVERSRIFEDDKFALACGRPRPAHAGVGAEQAFVRGEVCESGIDYCAFACAHVLVMSHRRRNCK